MIKPAQYIENSRVATTKASLQDIASAAKMYSLENGYYAPDVNRDLPMEYSKYMHSGPGSNGPFPGSVYDWDNWDDQTCWDGSTHIIQVTLRQINDYQGKKDYTLYYVIQGVGIPHCSDSSARGICLNCPSRYP